MIIMGMLGGLVALVGIIIIGAMLIFTRVYLTPQQVEQIKLADTACNSSLGSLAGALSNTVATDCEQIRFIAPFLRYEMFIYFFGIMLFVIGIIVDLAQRRK